MKLLMIKNVTYVSGHPVKALMMKASFHFSAVVNLSLCLGWAIIKHWEFIDNVDRCSILASRKSRVVRLTYFTMTIICLVALFKKNLFLFSNKITRVYIPFRATMTDSSVSRVNLCLS